MTEKKSMTIDCRKNIIAITSDEENEIGLSQMIAPTIMFDMKFSEYLSLNLGEAIKWLYSLPASTQKLKTNDDNYWKNYIKFLGARSQKDYYSTTVGLTLVKEDGYVKISLYENSGKSFSLCKDGNIEVCPFDSEKMGKKILELIELGKELNGIE